jgi:hypothetical protein
VDSKIGLLGALVPRPESAGKETGMKENVKKPTKPKLTLALDLDKLRELTPTEATTVVGAFVCRGTGH